MIFNKGEEVYDRKIKTYTHQSQFGCESTFIPEICVAMPQHSILHISVTSTDNNIGANPDNIIPYKSGVLTIIKTSSYVRAEFTGCNSGGSSGDVAYANMNLNTSTLSGWHNIGLVQKDISKQISFTQPTSGNVTINSIKAWTKGNTCELNISVSNSGEWASGATIEIPISGLPVAMVFEWKIGLVVGANFIGCAIANNSTQIRLRNLGSGTMAPFTNSSITFAYTI